MLKFLWRGSLKRARNAARSNRWPEAVNAYRDYLNSHPHDGKAWVQLGHSLKEAGRAPEAAEAYRRAVEIVPEMVEIWIHLAHVELRLGHRLAAIDALERALARESAEDQIARSRAVHDLVEMGERERLPLSIQQQIEGSDGCYARSRYAEFLEDPALLRLRVEAKCRHDVLSVVDARGASLQAVAATCDSLGGGACLILRDDAAAFEDIERARARYLLLVLAGTIVEPHTIETLCAAAQATGAAAVYCDHDHWEVANADYPASRTPNKAIFRQDPCFQPMFDPIWFRREEVCPPCILVEASVTRGIATWNDLFARRLALSSAYAHVPLILASREKSQRRVGPPAALPALVRDDVAASIQVIIQTRDAPEMLERCVESLLQKATRPERIDILIVDNRSVLDQTARLLAKWSARGLARVMTHDEPFNWARANNLAAARARTTHLLFLNNDVEMDSAGWDDVLVRELAQDDVGAVGALLLYPDRLIQHAGIVFGKGDGAVVHEGVGQLVEEGGPADRWKHSRLASAVTGAWLGTTRSLFEAVAGFEERLPVAYNDVDFSLRCREAGRLVLQSAEIVAVHRESATRGSVMTRSEHERDQADWAWLRSRWGEALVRDPGFNPNWARTGQPFDGLCAPTEETLARWIADSARKRPWIL